MNWLTYLILETCSRLALYTERERCSLLPLHGTKNYLFICFAWQIILFEQHWFLEVVAQSSEPFVLKAFGYYLNDTNHCVLSGCVRLDEYIFQNLKLTQSFTSLLQSVQCVCFKTGIVMINPPYLRLLNVYLIVYAYCILK